ncbi:hypothetical protein ACUH7Y_24970 [Clostridium beijerinckii]|uniref:Uncharacterized protein n=1 Tax=Clostridium beijerinckii TaxID=1520 RepID=A0A7X9XNJ4_CLOBE|nr:hypothetical protein [Clostridium beijerinckii]NMF04339.1 hypothetical protein [Clostridium beijerinckii]
MIKDYYTMIPNNLVWALEEGEVALIKDYDKLLVTMVYLDTHVNNIGQCCFTLEDLIIKSGFLARTGKNNSIEQFKSTLLYLQTLGWLDSTLDIADLKPKQFVSCKYEVQFQKEDLTGNSIYYFKLYYDKFKKIMDSDTKLEKLITLKIYCYILARMKRNSSDQKESRDTQYWNDTVIECFYDSYKVICKDLDITDTTFNAHLQLLKELELTFYDNIGLVKDDFGSHIANNVYAETEDWLSQGLKASREYYIGEGYTLVGKKCSKQTTVKKGLKGQITKQTNEGKDTKELESKLEELEEVIDNVKIVKVKRKGIGKQLEYRNSISCQEDNYNDICHQIENGQGYWGEANSFNNPFEIDTYKSSEFDKGVNPVTGSENEWEKYRDKEYEDFIDSLL